MIKGMNHVGISVADLQRSIEFYRDGFGMRVVVQKQFGGELYETIMALRGATGNVALLSAANLQIELFEFARPKPKPFDSHRPVCDYGINHFCIDVVDIETECDRLTALGASFHCPPMAFFGIAKVTYGRDPDGNVFELVEMIETNPNERQAVDH